MGKYDDDETEDVPVERTGRTRRRDESLEEEKITPDVTAAAGRVIKRGWSAAETVKSADSPFAQRLQVTNDAILIKFLEDDPYTSYHQHWIERQGQKSFTCTRNIHPKGCPLCDAGERPSARFSFNVALIVPGEEPLLRSYDVGPRIVDSLKNFHQDPKMGPLPRHYWAVSKTGKGTSSQTNHQMVKESDLVEDWDTDPLTEKQIADLRAKAYTASIVPIPTYQSLQKLAAEELAS